MGSWRRARRRRSSWRREWPRRSRRDNMSELAVNGALAAPSDAELIEELARARARIAQEIGKRVVGQEGVIEQLLIALFSRGHCLFVGVPGLAKTLLISTLAEALSLTFSRIQFTPDLMPSDITGTDVLEEDHTTGRRAFRFVAGPVFAHVLLADEINRTPPKTQAALLQAMQEDRVTAGGRTHLLREPLPPFPPPKPHQAERAAPIRSRSRSSSSPPRTQSSRKGPIRCPRRSSTGSCSWSTSPTRAPRKR